MNHPSQRAAQGMNAKIVHCLVRLLAVSGLIVLAACQPGTSSPSPTPTPPAAFPSPLPSQTIYPCATI